MADAQSLAQLRLLINDTDEDNETFDDDQCAAFLTLEGGNVRLAAAQALDTIASSQALLAKKAKVGPIEIDETSVAKELRDRAASLRLQALERSNDGTVVASAFDIVDFDPTSWFTTE